MKVLKIKEWNIQIDIPMLKSANQTNFCEEFNIRKIELKDMADIEKECQALSEINRRKHVLRPDLNKKLSII